MNKNIEISLPFVAPVGTPGVLQLLHDRPTSKAALLSIDMGYRSSGRIACAPLTCADMRQLVDGLMDAINAIERHERLCGEA